MSERADMILEDVQIMKNSQKDKDSSRLSLKYGAKQALSSSAGAIVTSLFMTPLDVVKIRLQSQNRPMHKGDCYVYRNGLSDHLCQCFNGRDSWYNRQIPGGKYHGTIDAMVKIVRAEGFSSLWSGLSPTLFMAFPQVVLYFTAYEEVKRMMNYHELNNPNPVIPVLSGGIARIIAVTAISPIELIRTKIQSEKLDYQQIVNAVRNAIRNDGFISLYRGWSSTILRDVPFSMIYWFNYESFKILMIKYRKKTPLSNIETFVCGATAGSIAAFITCPLDVVKTYRQIQLGVRDVEKSRRRTFHIIKEIRKIKGIKGLFAGVTPRVTKVAFSCAIMITTFEYFRKLFDGT